VRTVVWRFPCGTDMAYVVAWKPTVSGTAVVDAARPGGGHHTYVARIDGTCAATPGSLCHTDEGGVDSARIAFRVTPGQSYMLATGTTSASRDDSDIVLHAQVIPDTAPTCMPPDLVDLDAVGQRAGAVTTYAASRAWRFAEDGLAPPT